MTIKSPFFRDIVKIQILEKLKKQQKEKTGIYKECKTVKNNKSRKEKRK